MKTHDFQAEREGFEPSKPFGLRAFQARALGQTMRPLHAKREYSIPAGHQQILVEFEECGFVSKARFLPVALLKILDEHLGKTANRVFIRRHLHR